MRRHTGDRKSSRCLSGMLAGVIFFTALASSMFADAAGQAAAYLREGVGARALGMGNAHTAESGDANAAYWNPAGLPYLPTLSFASQTAFLGMERSWNFLNGVYPGTRTDGARYALGVSWIGFSAGQDIEARTFQRPEPDYYFEDLQNTFMLSAATVTPSNLSLGTNLKLINHTLDGTSGSGLGMDLAAFYCIDDQWQTGLVLQDVYSVINWPGDYQDRLPLFLRAGAAYRMKAIGLVFTGDLGGEFFHAPGAFREWRYRLGGEYRIAKPLFVRAGMDSGRWTAGLGFAFDLRNAAHVRLDYALAQETAEGMGLTHLLSLVVNLQSSK